METDLISLFLVLIPAALVCGYLLLILYYVRNWRPVIQESQVNEFCSVVIAVRNEEQGIQQCIDSIRHQSISRSAYEIIVVNDHSEDQTASIVKAFDDVRLITADADAHGKKKALAAGIRSAKGSIIVVTDGDCVVQREWLKNVMAAFQPHTRMVTGPLLIDRPRNLFERFQALEQAGLNLITASGIHSGLHHLANGANMAFRKSAFEEAGGFAKDESFASGDDLFLIQRIARAHPGSVGYVWSPSAAVYTRACSTLSEFFEQRIRWASKNKALSEKAVQRQWIFIGVTFAVLFVALFIAWFVSLNATFLIIGFILLVAIAEYLMLAKAVRYYKIPNTLKSYPLSFVLHKMYVLSMGLLVPFRKGYKWKGRNVR